MIDHIPSSCLTPAQAPSCCVYLVYFRTLGQAVCSDPCGCPHLCGATSLSLFGFMSRSVYTCPWGVAVSLALCYIYIYFDQKQTDILKTQNIYGMINNTFANVTFIIDLMYYRFCKSNTEPMLPGKDWNYLLLQYPRYLTPYRQRTKVNVLFL